jgi:hypothetical protein
MSTYEIIKGGEIWFLMTRNIEEKYGFADR